MVAEKIKKLENNQLETFNKEYVNEERWPIVKQMIDHSFPEGRFSFLDIGGGNGIFTDKILAHYPNAVGTLLDNAEVLLEMNKSHPRKNLILSSAENLNKIFKNQNFDVIFFNWVLHHFVAETYWDTRKTQNEILMQAQSILSEKGYISIFENMYVGALFKSLPSHLIFNLTSNKKIAPVTKIFGANTAGCGVCFLSDSTWKQEISKTDLSIANYQEFPKWKINILRKILLHIGSVRVGHFWLKRG